MEGACSGGSVEWKVPSRAVASRACGYATAAAMERMEHSALCCAVVCVVMKAREFPVGREWLGE